MLIATGVSFVVTQPGLYAITSNFNISLNIPKICRLDETRYIPDETIEELQAKVAESSDAAYDSYYKARVNLARKLDGEGKTDKAIAALHQSADVSIVHQEFVITGDIYFALGLIFEDIGQTEDAKKIYHKAAEVYEQGIKLLKQGKQQQSLGFWGSENKLAEANESLGNTLEKLNKRDEAIRAYQSAVDASLYTELLMPGFSQLERLLFDLERFDELLTTYKRLIQRDPNSTWVTDRIIKFQEFRKVDDYYRKVTQSKPDDLNLYLQWVEAVQIAHFLESSPKKIYRQIAENYKAILISDGSYVAPEWAKLLADRNQFEAALIIYQKDIAINPQNAASFAGMGKSLQALNRIKEAIVAYRQAMTIDTNNYSFYQPIVEALEQRLIQCSNNNKETQRYKDTKFFLEVNYIISSYHHKYGRADFITI
jgi:tetratricopeptide (TPR) repeat protein